MLDVKRRLYLWINNQLKEEIHLKYQRWSKKRSTSQIQDEEEVLETNYEQPKVVTQTTSTIRTAQKQPKQVVRQQYYHQEDVNREKYTSTMDITLRRQIKIACATRGIMFAKFVEDACREKLQREGGR